MQALDHYETKTQVGRAMLEGRSWREAVRLPRQLLGHKARLADYRQIAARRQGRTCPAPLRQHLLDGQRQRGAQQACCPGIQTAGRWQVRPEEFSETPGGR